MGLYERYARASDEDRTSGTWIEIAWVDRFIQLLPESATVLDLVCGPSAPIARHLAEQAVKTVAVGHRIV